MKTIIATLALGLSLLVSAGAGAQNSGTIKPAQPAAAPAATAAAAAPATAAAAASAVVVPSPVPGVESIDILKQDQAQRSKDQPGNLAPTWRIVKEGTPNYSSLPALESSVLIQPKAQFPGQARATTAGEAWRQYRNGPLTVYGGWLIVLVLVAIAAVYFSLGQIKQKAPDTGRLIERFTSVERTAHWTLAISFMTLAASGLVMLFGKYVLLPVFGHTLFGWLAYACKNIHNFVGPVFSLAVIVAFIIFVKDNLPGKGDIKWVLRAGGMFGKHEVPSGRFNAGEKLWFWGGVVVLGVVLTASGFFLDMLVPAVEYTRGNMQVANVIHLAAAVLMFAVSMGHVYMGTLGMQGAYKAMRTGYVDDAWAKEHHELWYEDVANGRVPRVRTEEGAAAVAGSPAKAS
ncbi:formate dehydrogenase subunit gamma [Lacisediminimonas profundi]|uniref:formate dehydrogenase subunit gamma n=1 Tax=Lacisediminimonas profundi TaxID=2603856 RepID=UPI00124B2561|nr:formate dehydrogenase subunit gamma [Lacisediminimonas profundi]